MRKNAFLFILLLAAGAFAASAIYQYKQTEISDQPVQSKKIRIAYPYEGTLISGEVGLILQRTDILKKKGFEAEIFPMATGKEMKTALVAGQVDVIMTSESNFVVLLGNGFDCYAVASFGPDGQMGLAVNADSDINDIAGLRNKKVGTLFGTSVHNPTIEWIRESGLDPKKDVEIINLGDLGTIQSSLISKNVAAAMLWDPYLFNGVNRGLYRTIRAAGLDTITVMSAEYAKDEAGVAAFKQALRESLFYLSQNKEQVAGWYDKQDLGAAEISEILSINKNYNVSSLDQIDIGISGEFISKLENIAAFLNNEKLIEKLPEVTKYIKL